jgi:6-bladed beta-propeller
MSRELAGHRGAVAQKAAPLVEESNYLEASMRRFAEVVLVAVIVLVTSPLFAQTSVPEIPFDSTPNFLKLPDNVVMGEAVGVATNSKGHVFVYTRDGTLAYTVGTSREFGRGAAARLYEFDETGKFIREIGKGTYAEAFAHTVRIDPKDNIWVNDEGADMTVEYSPEGKVMMTLGRRPEDYLGTPGPVAEGQSTGGVSGGQLLANLGRELANFRAGTTAPPRPPGAAPEGGGISAGPFITFNRQTDIAWDSNGNMFVSDGYNNKRVVKIDKDGNFVKQFGSRGRGPGQFEDVHTIQVDHAGNVYVGDRSNKRLNVFDNDGNFKTAYINVGSPWAVCITPGEHQYIYSSNSTGTSSMEDGGEIYKMELDGRIVGKFGTGGKLLKQFMAVHELDCRADNVVMAGEISNWRVQKLTLHPTK